MSEELYCSKQAEIVYKAITVSHLHILILCLTT